MGCGSSGSSQAGKGNEAIREDVVEPFPSSEWASKKQEAGQATSSAAASKDASSPKAVGSGGGGSGGSGGSGGGGSGTLFSSGSPAAAAGGGAASKASKNQKVTEQVVLNDVDVESDVEVIFEGKMSSQQQQQNQGQNPQDANAQEAPTSAEPDVGASPKNSMPDEQKPIVLSKQQQEEAAKMAEQRKRFDNQRYQSQHAGGGGDPGYNSPGGSAVVSKLPLSPKEGIVPSIAAHEAVMGVNASTSPRKVPRGMETECLPGGIMDDTPRGEVYIPQSRNNHQVFDDDEEMLMKDIMEEIEGGHK